MLFRDVRLRALLDAPSAFSATYAEESRLTDADWLNRAAERSGRRSTSYLAMDGKNPCGIVAGFIDKDDRVRAHLVSMWVAPTHRRLISPHLPVVPSPTTWGCLIIAYHHASVISEFRTSPWMSWLVAAPPPNRVRSPTNQQFASGCSPPRLTATQLPSATELWLPPTRTFTVLLCRLHGRTHPPECFNRGSSPDSAFHLDSG